MAAEASLHDLQSDLRTLRLQANKKNSYDQSKRKMSSPTSRKTMNRRRSSHHSHRIELQRANIYEKNTFMSIAIRNPITGQVRLEGVEDWLDFAFVDLWTRPSLTGSPDQLSTDRYMLKPTPLLYRSWIYHGLNAEDQQMQFDGKEVTRPAIMRALASPCIDAPLSAGRWSPVMTLAPQLFPIVLVGNFTLMLVCLMTFLFCLFVAVHINHHVWYRGQRLVTLPVRVMFLVTLFNTVSVPGLLNQGKVINAFGYIIAVGMTLADLCLGDGVTLLCRQLESVYEPLRELPKNVWVCRKKDGQPDGGGNVEAKRNRLKIDKGITGVNNWDENIDLCLIADVHGLLVELVKPSKDEWMAFLNTFRKTGQPIKYMAQECFNVMKQTLEDIEDPTRRMKNRSLNQYYLVPLQDGRLVTREEMDSGKIELQDYESDEEESP